MTRTCTDEVRGHQQKRRSATTAVREALRHRRAVRGACPTTMDLLDLHVHRLQKKTARGSDSEAKATANLMAAQQLSWILSSKKTRLGSRRRARRVVCGEGGEGGAKSGVFLFLTQKPKNPIPPPARLSNLDARARKPRINLWPVCG